MKIYMDNCCFNRILDDRSYPNVYLECNSVMIILEMIEKGFVELCGSKMLRMEIDDTPNSFKREKLELMYSLCASEIEVTEDIVERALDIQNNSNIRSKDSIHLACAEAGEVDFFLTVDKKFRNNANRLQAKVQVISPTEWLMEVLYGKDD